MNRAGLLVLVVACDAPSSECRTRLDCGDGEHCFVDSTVPAGTCVSVDGRDEPTPPMRVIHEPARVDVLFVIDDGPGGAEAQSRLVASVPAMLDEAARARSRLRIAATTANAASPFCAPRAWAQHGRPVITSCLDRLGDFVGSDGTDARATCTSVCSRSTDELPIRPERPWVDLETFGDREEAAEVLACLLPQGISGCELAAPLRVAELAWYRAFTESEDAFGLFRQETSAQIVVVTDDLDCSVSEYGFAAFDPAGDRTLWPDPAAETASPAVCWSAGVECEGQPPVYDDCHAIDRGLDGAEVDGDAPSVLSSPWDFVWAEYLFAQVHVIGGVPVEGPPVYTTGDDPEFVAQHGIGPGCVDGDIAAVPPVRMLGIADSTHSICAPQYDAALRESVVVPAGLPFCVRPCEIAALTIHLERPDGASAAIPTCTGEDPWLTIPDGADACFIWREDSPYCGRTDAVELVLRSTLPASVGSFLIAPNPRAPSTTFPDCPP